MVLRRVEGARACEPSSNGSLVAIGNFDGVHVGHRTVLERACAEAGARNLAPLVVTFHPHPAAILGNRVPPCLTVTDRKVELLCRIGTEIVVVVEPFTLELSRKSPADFAREFLADALGARVVLVGRNFRFGHRRAGDLAVLRALGGTLGFEARVAELVGDGEGPYSSTRIRDLVGCGDLPAAEHLLGRPHSISGVVVRGDGRGRQLGFPTANLDGVAEALPPYGVYACLVDRLDAASGSPERLGAGVMNLGVRPTVSGELAAEVHLFDHSAELYGQALRVHLVRRMRDERKFSGVDALRQQIGRDVGAARELLAGRRPDPDAGTAWH